MYTERIIFDQEKNVTLTAYLQEVGGEFRGVEKRPAVLVLPGGGYQMCSDREADPVVFPYLKAGYQAFILRYSVKENAVWPNPLNDYEKAMELIREKANVWNVYEDKIAVIGFSAGGHLAACAATMARNRPNAAILGYAVTIGEDVAGCNTSAPDTISAVDRNTCPCFVFATRTDNVVPIANTTKFLNALAEHDVAFESHIYAFGPHGFSTCDRSVQGREPAVCDRAEDWVEDSIGWLKDVLGDFGNGGMTKPVCPLHMNADGEAYLSADCTFGYLLNIPAAQEVLAPILAGVKENAGGNAAGPDVINRIMGRMTLREVLAFGKVPDKIAEEIDGQLKKIVNV